MTPVQAARVLELPRPWTLRALKTAFRKKSLATHPDRGGDAEDFKAVSAARTVLEEHIEHRPSRRRRRRRSKPTEAPVPPPIKVGDYFEVPGIRCRGAVLRGKFRAQLVELEAEGADEFGQKVIKRLMFAVYCHTPVKLEGTIVEIVLKDKHQNDPDVLIRKVVQRSYNSANEVTVFWVDALNRPVVEESYVYGRRGWWS